MIARDGLLTRLRRGMERSPVTALIGPRQCGKTTLARMLPVDGPGAYFDLEDSDDLLRLENPRLALEALRGLVVIDEIQRRPELFPLLRVLVDRPTEPARFVILGSASPELLRQSSESLAGRIEYIEMAGFGLDEVGTENREQLWERGSFPRAYLASSDEDSFMWRKQFVKTYLERDLPELGIRIPSTTLERFWMMMAHRHGALLNASELATSFGISDHTSRSYVDLLTSTFMLRQLQPWHENITKRQVKSPKIYFRDSGLLHTFLGLRTVADLRGHPSLGASWEGFALEHILRLTGSDQSYFWATHAGAELDLLKWIGGARIGFEIKYADAPKPTKSMHIAVADLSLQRLLVVHPGGKTYPLNDTMTSVALRDLPDVLSEL